jgi:hypothetical protein
MKIVMYHNGVLVPEPKTCKAKLTHGICENGIHYYVRKNQRLTIIKSEGYGYKVKDNKGQIFTISFQSVKDVE